MLNFSEIKCFGRFFFITLMLGSFACCNGDTWASELGTVVGKAEPYLITSWKKVPRGMLTKLNYMSCLMKIQIKQ